MKKEFSDLLAQGLEHFDGHRYDEAESVFSLILESHPGMADVQNHMGFIYHQRGDLVAAREFFRKAVDLNPTYTEAAMNLAVTLNELGRYDEAERALNGVAESARLPDKGGDLFLLKKIANEHFRLGTLYLEIDRSEDALDEFRKAEKLFPDMPDVLVRHGVTLRKLGRGVEAAEKFRSAVRINPAFTMAWMELATTLFQDKQEEEARDELRKALAVQPDSETLGRFLEFLENRG